MLTVQDLSLLLLSFEVPPVVGVVGLPRDSLIHSYATFIPPSSRSSAHPLKALVLSVTKTKTESLHTPAPVRISGTLLRLPPSLKCHDDLTTFDIVLVTSTSKMATTASLDKDVRGHPVPAVFAISGKLDSKDLGGCDAWAVDTGINEGWLVG